MPIRFAAPGVYVEEVPIAARSIEGVATSVAAFVGWLARGDVDGPMLMESIAEFEQTCGGADERSLMSHAVCHYFNNGGQRACIVRLVADDAAAATAVIDGTLRFSARNPGEWGKNYAVSLSANADGARFRVQVLHTPPASVDGIVVESFSDVSMDSNDARYVVDVIESGSALIRAEVIDSSGAMPATTPQPVKLAGENLDGTVLRPNEVAFEAALLAPGRGVHLLDQADIFNLLCVPGETRDEVLQPLQKFCRERRAFLIADCSADATYASLRGGVGSLLAGDDAMNSALYFPWVTVPGQVREYPPCGFVAGIYARTDAQHGVWKAPAGTGASLAGAAGLKITLTERESDELNARGINCLRNFTARGTMVWGSRTLAGASAGSVEWKYVPVRRLALHIEQGISRGLGWAAFEANDEALWARVRAIVGDFMFELFRRGAFPARSADEAYFVKCDRETTTQADIDNGFFNMLIGFAPLKPAEFIVIRHLQSAGQASQ